MPEDSSSAMILLKDVLENDDLHETASFLGSVSTATGKIF
jgi:hypothetical protein